MELIFYICSFVAILTTLLVITHNNPVYALLYLIISLLAISGVFFSFGAYFAGALEVIVYAGAIMVLFVFVVMLMNLENPKMGYELRVLVRTLILTSTMMLIVVSAILEAKNKIVFVIPVSIKEVGISLLGTYMLVVELASILLTAGLVVTFHLGYKGRCTNMKLSIKGTNTKKIEKHA